MDEINLLSGAAAAPKKDDKDKGHAPKEEEMTLHVPAPEPEFPAPDSAGGFLAALKAAKPAAEPPASIMSQKIEPLAAPKPAPKAPIAPPPAPLKMTVPPPPPPPPRPPSPPQRPHEDEKNGGTLRVSLITTGAEAGFSDIALRRRLRTFALVGLLGLIVDGLIFGGLLYQKSVVEKRNGAAEQSVKDVDAQIAAREKDLAPVRDFQSLVKVEATVLDNHEHWTEVLRLLEDRALPDVQFGSLAGADTGTLSFEIFARDYTTLAKQIIAFRQDPRVLKVVTGSASADFGENNLLKGVRSEMTLSISPSVFKFNPAAASATATPAAATTASAAASGTTLVPAVPVSPAP